MQCPLSSCCCMSPKVIFSLLGCFGLALGVFSAWAPQRSIAFYQWIMKGFNWSVAPIDLPREVRNTRRLGLVLAALSVAIFVIVARRF